MIGEFKFYLLPLHAAEGSVLVDVLHTPGTKPKSESKLTISLISEMLFPQESKLRDQCAKGGVVTR